MARNVSLKILNKPKTVIGKSYDLRLTGKAWLTTYVTSGDRQGYSIVVEGFATGGDQK